MPEHRTPDLRWPEVWRRRNATIFDFLRRHTATTAHLAERFFPGRTLEEKKKKASKWLVKQRKRKRVAVVGVALRRDTGRPEIAYGRRCKPQELEHELRVTDFANIFKDSTITRDAKVGNTEADGLMIRDGERCYIEIDNSGKMNAAQMKAKWGRYQGVEGFILVVAVTETRMERLRRGAELVKAVALFNTFARLKDGLPWIDWYGNTAEL